MIDESSKGLPVKAFPFESNLDQLSNYDVHKKRALLDPNHNCFLLIDHGKEDFGGEIEFRAKFEHALARMGREADLHVPVVMIVVEGGPGTIKYCGRGRDCIGKVFDFQ